MKANTKQMAGNGKDTVFYVLEQRRETGNAIPEGSKHSLLLAMTTRETAGMLLNLRKKVLARGASSKELAKLQDELLADAQEVSHVRYGPSGENEIDSLYSRGVVEADELGLERVQLLPLRRDKAI